MDVAGLSQAPAPKHDHERSTELQVGDDRSHEGMVDHESRFRNIVVGLVRQVSFPSNRGGLVIDG